MNTDHQATLQDQSLLEGLHPLSTKLLRWAGKKPVRQLPVVGTIVSDGELIRQIMTNKKAFSKQGKGVSSSLWNPIIGDTGLLNMEGSPHLELKRSLATVFSSQNVAKFASSEIDIVLDRMIHDLHEGDTVDLVEVVSRFVYKALWRFAGFSDELINQYYTEETVADLRSATHGINLTKKQLPEARIIAAKKKLSFIDDVVSAAYAEGLESMPVGSVMHSMMENSYSLEETTSLMKALMITGTETVISFVPRMIALLIDSGKFTTLTAEEVPLAIDECLRVIVPTPVAVRAVLQDTTLQGVRVKAGTRVVLNTLEACRNTGGDFNSNLPPVSREVKGLWFGAGVHMCIGLPIAMLEAEKTLTTMMKFREYGVLGIMYREAANEGHTGSYAKLFLKLEKDSNG